MEVDRDQMCFVCLHYKGDPDDHQNDDEWVKCGQCGTWGHEMCITAIPRCECGQKF